MIVHADIANANCMRRQHINKRELCADLIWFLQMITVPAVEPFIALPYVLLEEAFYGKNTMHIENCKTAD